jgi:hypothetical protein
VVPLAVGYLPDSSGWNSVLLFMTMESLFSFALVSTLAEPTTN